MDAESNVATEEQRQTAASGRGYNVLACEYHGLGSARRRHSGPDFRRLGRNDLSQCKYRAGSKVRDDETSSPARYKRALPGKFVNADAAAVAATIQ
jgi:hypothetical protein